MTPLRQKLIDEIQLRGFSPHTQASYVRCVSGLARFYHRAPDQVTDEELKAYLLYLLREKQLAVGSLIVAVSGLRFFFGRVLHRPTEAIEQALPRMKKPVLRPKVYSVQELERFFNQPKLNRKHRALFMTAYAAGLRVSEVCQLRICDLLSDRHQIHVVQAKGKNYAKVVVMQRWPSADRSEVHLGLYLAGNWGSRKPGEICEKPAVCRFRFDKATVRERLRSAAYGRQPPWHNSQRLRHRFVCAGIRRVGDTATRFSR